MSGPVVIWKITSASSSAELPTYDAYKAVDQIATLNPRELVIRGGDPLQRADLFHVLEYASRRGLTPAVAFPSVYNLTDAIIARLSRSGVKRLIFTVDSSRTSCEPVDGMTLDVNTLLTRSTVSDLPAIADRIEELDPETWNVYFPLSADVMNATEAEQVFGVLASLQDEKPFLIRTVEAPQYRRYLMQRLAVSRWGDSLTCLPAQIAEAARDDVIFIGPNGEVHPGEFLPVAAGNIRHRALAAIIAASDLFVALADRTNLTGKCQGCEFRQVCGGSRARAWITGGLLFGSDPLCAYQPRLITSREPITAA